MTADGVKGKVRYFGMPSGYEFSVLLGSLLDVSKGKSELSEPSIETLQSLHKDLHIQVFVTPTCPHCPRAVTLAHRMAVEHPQIRATCVEATEFMDLTRQYRVTGVPKTIVNGTIELLGAVPEDAFVRTVLQQPTTPA